MINKSSQRSIMDVMNEILSAVRDYYDSEYVYYVEKEDDTIGNIYEWCANDVPWQRDRIKMCDKDQYPKWLRQEITDTTQSDYSVFYEIEDGVTAVLAAVGVHRGGCDIALLKTVIPYISQAMIFNKMQRQQEYLSYHDDLTGLLNRNSFMAYLDEYKRESLKALGVVSVDINGLKNFNKEFGREYGDEVVTRVGEVLEEFFRGAYVFRLTGDEYLVVLENATYEQFITKVEGAENKLNNISLGLASIGYAWQKIDINIDTLVSHAENMMREEKKKYYKNLKKGHHEPIIKQDLLNDIEEGRFIVCLVPKVDVMTEEIIGAEAVVRYHHKDLGIMNPGRYITLLEETQLAHYLDFYVFEQVCKILKRWESENLPMLPISVNLSSTTIRRVSFAEKMIDIVKKYNVSCEHLEVEVSESYSELNQEMLAEVASKLRKENIRVTLDHFGHRESSFSVLAMMEFDGLKFDKHMISDIVTNGREQIAAKAVIDLCHRLGVNVIAAGVETQDQLNVLKELGCDYAQGSMFNKPITVDTFEIRYLKG